MNELRLLRKKNNITQIEAANLLDISRKTYQKYDALTNEDDKKYQYFLYQLKKATLVDEENGTLSIDDIKVVVNTVFSKYNVNFCYLFGSYAKGKEKPDSDVDLLIDSEITGLNFFGLVEELRQTLHKKVDLLKLNQLNNNPDLLREILKDGIKIYG